MALLDVVNITSGYGETIIVREVSLRLDEGKLTALVGSNGAGKTTLLHTVMGLLKPRQGKLIFRGEEITRQPSYVRSRLGITMVPEGRQLFTNMTVSENLEMGAAAVRDRVVRGERLEFVFRLFPRIKERLKQKAGTLSGGEQQMAAIARSLMAGPKLLIFDELTLGLSPALSLSLFETLRQLKAAGQTMLLVEQNVRLALALSDYAYVLSEGKIHMEGPAKSIADHEDVRQAFLGM